MKEYDIMTNIDLLGMTSIVETKPNNASILMDSPLGPFLRNKKIGVSAILASYLPGWRQIRNYKGLSFELLGSESSPSSENCIVWQMIDCRFDHIYDRWYVGTRNLIDKHYRLHPTADYFEVWSGIRDAFERKSIYLVAIDFGIDSVLQLSFDYPDNEEYISPIAEVENFQIVRAYLSP